MGGMTYPLQWHPSSYAHPNRGDVSKGDLDQMADLTGPYWADLGPHRDGWSWTVLNFDEDNAPVLSGTTSTEAAAKAAVEAVAQTLDTGGLTEREPDPVRGEG